MRRMRTGGRADRRRISPRSEATSARWNAGTHVADRTADGCVRVSNRWGGVPGAGCNQTGPPGTRMTFLCRRGECVSAAAGCWDFRSVRW